MVDGGRVVWLVIWMVFANGGLDLRLVLSYDYGGLVFGRLHGGDVGDGFRVGLAQSSLRRL